MLAGFISSGHCAGMCGGIVNILAGSTVPGKAGILSRKDIILVAYNLGRINSYVVAGMIAGTVGSIIGRALPGPAFQATALLFSAAFMLGLAAYLTGWRSFLAFFERLGGHLWRRIEPVGRKIFPVSHAGKAWCLGLVWGWLPCGLVYSALAWSIASGGTIQGGVLMLGFGIGTLPTLMVVGSGALTLQGIKSSPWLQYFVAALMTILAVYMCTMALDIIWGDTGGTGMHSH